MRDWSAGAPQARPVLGDSKVVKLLKAGFICLLSGAFLLMLTSCSVSARELSIDILKPNVEEIRDDFHEVLIADDGATNLGPAINSSVAPDMRGLTQRENMAFGSPIKGFYALESSPGKVSIEVVQEAWNQVSFGAASSVRVYACIRFEGERNSGAPIEILQGTCPDWVVEDFRLTAADEVLLAELSLD